MREAVKWLAILLSSSVALAEGASVEPIHDLQWLFIEDTVALIAPSNDAIGDRARALMDAAARSRAAGALSDMRRQLSEARVILGGGEWQAASAFTASIAIRPHATVIDSSRPAVVSLGQYFSAQPPTLDPITFELGLRTWRPRAPFDEHVRWLASSSSRSLDLLENPVRMSLPVDRVAPGSYDLVVRATQSGQVLGVSARRVFIVNDLDRDLARIESGARNVAMSETLRASILYPGNLIAGLNDGSRQVRALDVRATIDRSLELLQAAEAGHDPLTRSKGNQERHYWLAEFRRYEPYRLIVPEHWNGRAKLPLLVVLHGSNGDHNSVLTQPKLIEQATRRGWAVLSPMGYSPNSGWGNHLPVVLANGTMPRPRPSTIEGIVLPVDGVDPEPAELDVRRTIEQVRTEYPIDARRIYLIGNSMGGEGTWHLAARYPNLWAAVVPAAGAIDPEKFPYAALRRMPVLSVHGERDAIVSYAASADMIRRLQREGGHARLLTVLDGGHDAVYNVLPAIFDFFAKHARRDDGSFDAR